jgi:hypothetical protein
MNQDGYYHRIVSVIMAIQYLAPAAQRENNNELVQFYGRKRDELINMIPSVRDKKW